MMSVPRSQREEVLRERNGCAANIDLMEILEHCSRIRQLKAYKAIEFGSDAASRLLGIVSTLANTTDNGGRQIWGGNV